jgi:hypothetical protein
MTRSSPPLIGRQVVNGRNPVRDLPKTLLPSLSAKLLYDRLVGDWSKLGISWLGGDRRWTQTLLKWFREEGKALGFQAYPDPNSDGHPEYLVDLCWSFEEEWSSPARMGVAYHGLILAMESEWAQSWDEILDDFNKLLDVKAVLKVFLCAPTKNQLEDLPKRLLGQFENHLHQTLFDQYLILAFDPDSIHAWSLNQQDQAQELGSVPYPSA